jgi:hypothetical protein
MNIIIRGTAASYIISINRKIKTVLNLGRKGELRKKEYWITLK